MRRSKRSRIWTAVVMMVMFSSCRPDCGTEQEKKPAPPAESGSPAKVDFSHPVRVAVEETLERLLAEEDTDGDKKITVADPDEGGGRGDKEFILKDRLIGGYEVKGTYQLSNLLQELALAREEGRSEAEIAPERLHENPVDRISRLIRERYWQGLTRQLDEEHLPAMLADPKVQLGDTVHYLYVPYDDRRAQGYFRQAAARHPEWKLKVITLPEKITPEYVRSLNGRHGLLALALREEGGKVEGVPFVVPGGRFNEMYGWDSYFIALGLLADGRLDLARAMVENLSYEIEHYGMILNANRSYYLLRSQPPFFTSMILAVYEKMEKTEESRQWLARAMGAAIKEYEKVWTAPPRQTESGLSRYAGVAAGPCPEVEPGHYDWVLKPYAEKLNLTPGQYLAELLAGRLRNDDLEEFFLHDRALRESGHDTTYRFDDRTADFLAVDLNSLLYKYEMDIAWTIDEVFAGRMKLSPSRTEKSASWRKRAEERKARMLRLMVLQEDFRGASEAELLAGFFDYDLHHGRRSDYLSAATFYPLWAGLATAEQADYVVRVLLPRLEQPGGVAASDPASVEAVSAGGSARQWDYPYGWSPHQILIWEALRNYGYEADAARLIYKWLYMITRNAADYNGTIPEKFDVVARSHEVFAEYGNVGTDFDYITREGFGWMNASYQVGLKLLPSELVEKLRNLTSPEEIFPPAGEQAETERKEETSPGETTSP